MPRKKLLIAVVVIAVLVVLAVGYVFLTGLQKPSVQITGVALRNVSATTTTLDIDVAVDNPNSVGATLSRIVYDVYYSEGGTWKFLGHGDKTESMEIKANGVTQLTITNNIENTAAMGAMYQFLLAQHGELTVKVQGTVTIDLKATLLDYPFEEVRDVTIPLP